MARLRRELIQTYNTCVVSQRHVKEFYDLVLAVTKEAKKFQADVEVYNKDRKALQVQVTERADKAAAERAKLVELAADAVDPIVRVFSFTDKTTLDVWAKTKGVSLDARTSLESMKAVFIKEYKEPVKPTEDKTVKDNK